MKTVQDLKPYPAYKPSGVDWLGDVPAHWEVRRLRTVGEAIIGLTYSPQDVVDEEEGTIVLRASNISEGRIVYGDNVFVRCSVPDRLVTQMGDILICSRSGSRVLIGKNAMIDSASTGITFGAFMTIFRSAHNDYLHHVFNSKLFEYQSGAFLASTINQLTLGILYNFKISWPPAAEQTAIARYLDHADRRTQRYIQATQKRITLLHEARQATIQRAVTRGLDPDAPRKPSGVDWLGDVPAHWEVRRLGYLATKFGSGITPRGGATVYQEDGVPFLRSQNIHFDGLRIRDVARITPSLHRELSGSHVKPGDVLLNITGASIGRVCSIPDDFAEGNVNQHVCIIRPDQSRLLPGLLAAYLSTPMMQREIQIEQKGASREGLTLQAIRNFRVIVPPLAEQTAIAAYLNKATAAIDTAINTARRQSELMQEYRASLIAHVVTGKLDVRAAAERISMATS